MAEETKETQEVTQPVYDEAEALKSLSEGMERVFSGEVVEKKDDQLETEDADGETTDGTETESEDKGSDNEEPIPQEQVDIARKLGYTDEEIVQLAEEKPERLENMVKMYSQPKPVPTKEQEVVVQKSEPVKKQEVKPIDHVSMDDLGELEPESERIVKTLLKAHNSLIDKFNEQQSKVESLGEQTVSLSERDQRDQVRKIDDFFDEASEHLPELGKNGTLTQEQVKTRTEVYGMAAVLMQSRGMPQSKALEEATYMFGLSKLDINNLEKVAEERLKEKLNKQKTKMSPRPGGKKKVERVEHGKNAAIDFLTQGLKEITG